MNHFMCPICDEQTTSAMFGPVYFDCHKCHLLCRISEMDAIRLKGIATGHRMKVWSRLAGGIDCDLTDAYRGMEG